MHVLAGKGISILVRDYCVNQQNINGFTAYRCNRCETCGCLCGQCFEFKQGVQASDVGFLHEIGEEKFGLVEQLCELSYAHLGEVLRTQAGTFP